MKKNIEADFSGKEIRKNNPVKNPDRRKFLVKAARTGILLLLGTFIGKLVTGKKIALPGDQRCISSGICSRCRLNKSCMLPQAMSYRNITGRGKA